jgi:hypothetical protein
MKKLFSALLLACSMWNAFGQGTPILRNEFTTNNNAIARGVVTNIAQSLVGAASSNSAGFGQVNTNQFRTNNNRLTIGSDAPITNANLRGTTYLGVVNSGGGLVNTSLTAAYIIQGPGFNANATVNIIGTKHPNGTDILQGLDVFTPQASWTLVTPDTNTNPRYVTNKMYFEVYRGQDSVNTIGPSVVFRNYNETTGFYNHWMELSNNGNFILYDRAAGADIGPIAAIRDTVNNTWAFSGIFSITGAVPTLQLKDRTLTSVHNWFSDNNIMTLQQNGVVTLQNDLTAHTLASGSSVPDWSVGTVAQPFKLVGSNSIFLGTMTATKLSAVAGGNVKDANGNLYVTNSTGIDGGGSGGTNSAGFGRVDTGQFSTNGNILTFTNFAPLTNVVIKSAANTMALSVDTNVLVVTNGQVGIRKNPTSSFFVDVAGAVNVDQALTVGSSITSATVSATSGTFGSLNFGTPSNSVFEARGMNGTVIWHVDSTNGFWFTNMFNGKGLSVNTNGDVNVSGPMSVGAITHTNSDNYINQTLAGVGGANTNFTGQASSGVTYIDGGTTNVNFVAIMPGTSGQTYFSTYIISNLTTTARQLSFSSVTNNLFNLQQYDGITFPITLTNKHRLLLSVMLNGSNLTWAAKQCTNGF